DFVPGTTVWKATDFTNEPVGRFPASQPAFVSGNMQIVELDGAKVLEATSNGVFRVPLPEALPEAFTIEFYIRIPTDNMRTSVYTAPRAGARDSQDVVVVRASTGIYRRGNELSGMQVAGIVGA